MTQLLIVSKHAVEFQDLIKSADLPGLTIFATQDPAKAMPIAKDCELAFGEPSLLRQVVREMPHLRWVQSSWAGIEPLLAAGLDEKIILTNVRGVYGYLMSEYVFGYLLAIERRILPRWQAQQARIWDDTPPGTLQGKTIGLLGVGSIGAHLARTAQSFSMRVHGYTRHSEACPHVEQYFHAAQKLDFARGLDYLVCTLPGTVHTHRMVDAEMLAALPRHAWLVNIGRGSTLDEAALISALQGSRLSGAVLDVFGEEPLPPNHALWHTPNTFITAHTAALNYPRDIATFFIENYQRYLKNNPLVGLVSYKEGY